MSLQVYNKTDPPISVIVYNSPATFIGRDPSLGALYKQHLSTGTKTLLNVLNHPDKCFSTIDIVWDGKHFTKLSELKRYRSCWNIQR